MSPIDSKEKDILVGLGRHARVLVVEADPVSRLTVRQFLEEQGVHYDLVANGDEARKLYQRNRYRLVISDAILPDSNGIDLCRFCRAEASQYVYFILCSSPEDKVDRQLAFETGIDDFLSKPIDSDSLFHRLIVARRILHIESGLQVQKQEMEQASDALRAMNESLRHASRRFEELFNGLPVACFTMDEYGLIHEWNRQSVIDFKIPNHQVFQQPVWEVLGDQSSGFWNEGISETIQRGSFMEDQDWCLKTEDGSERYFVCNLFGLRDLSGGLIGAISANLDITERKEAERRIDEQMETINTYARDLQRQKGLLEKANARLEQMAHTDVMTGLMNHRGFQDELARAHERSIRIGIPLSLILMDVDHFKRFNDEFGHQGGDAILQRFGQMLQSVTRKNEPPARYGGEEFAVILEGASAETALAAAERIRGAIHKRAWPYRNITASFGVATSVSGELTREELIRRADIALYASKEGGRDRVSLYQDSHDVAA